eukprot:5813228-Ditylum_brightwellii.AAC.1
MPGVAVVTKVDELGMEVVEEDNAESMSNDEEDVLGNDGLDEGPAPLQTVQPPKLIFKGAL